MTKNYSNSSKKELIQTIQKLEARKKYGLVWDEERTKEKFEKESEGAVPILEEVKEKEICVTKSGPINILIEGDNYHALSVLSYTHYHSIDLIYIDPPYNTGNKSWTYNNKYIDHDDTYRHSKWLSFMQKRLRLAKELLREDGIIIVTIDDHEIGTLILLMDEIFGETNRLAIVTIVHNPGGRSDDKHFATSHEYALFYAADIKLASTSSLILTEEQKEEYLEEDECSRYRLVPFKRTGSNSTPKERPNLYYPIYVNLKTKEIDLEKKLSDEWITLYPIDSEQKKRVWRWSKPTLLERFNTEIVIKQKDGELNIYAKDRDKGGRKPKTVWNDPKYNASYHGTIMLQKILSKEKKFDYPKSLYAVLDTLQITTQNKKEAKILDFFAGSGTTGHAVLELNKRDGGNRQFILCTNNENDICTEICYPRINNVIHGYKSGQANFVKGYGGNLKYFKTSFIEKNGSQDELKISITEKCTEMLCLRENIFVQVKATNDYRIFEQTITYPPPPC